MAEIKSVRDLLGMNLDIPNYQRAYKWTSRNIVALVNDIGDAIADFKQFENFKYRIGTIILHHRKDKDQDVYDIVDGQQRIISLILLLKLLDPKFDCSILGKRFVDKITQANIHGNYWLFKEIFSSKKETDKEEYKKSFENILEVVVISVTKVTEAFQLFDSQNTRGKGLDPQDLLKAYHLREMKNYPHKMELAVTKWEAHDTKEIRSLFVDYLYPIWNWSRGFKSKTFTEKEIDTYKGITEDKGYTYAKRVGKAMPYFQISEPFLAGSDFFTMVDHYLLLLKVIKKKMSQSRFKDILASKTRNVGFDYALNLFYCALLCYYDKYHNFDDLALQKLFTWAFMLRIDMEHLGYDSVNKYAVGEENGRYTNKIAVFSRISISRLHTDISGISVKTEKPKSESSKWNELYRGLIAINGLNEVANE